MGTLTKKTLNGLGFLKEVLFSFCFPSLLISHYPKKMVNAFFILTQFSRTSILSQFYIFYKSLSYNISFTILGRIATYFKLNHLEFYIMILSQMNNICSGYMFIACLTIILSCLTNENDI